MTPVLILTRPAPQAEAFAAEIAARWAGALRIILSPLLQIVPVPVTADLTQVKGVIFTSAHGVAASRMADLPRGLPAWCVGEKTAQLAAEAGFDAIAGPGDAARLADKIIGRRPQGPLVHLHGVHTRGGICERLTGAGIACSDVIAYDQIAQSLTDDAFDALQGDTPVILPLFSPRTATILEGQSPFSAPVHLIVISTAVQSAAAAIGVRSLSVAATPDADAMIAATLKRLSVVAEPAS
ncbi:MULTISPECIES: uroporphyrinogen-III synthase [unclassified Yoonia]|uniref:uroporphyrinogen-III synthase n=1 Tax=unclassified Yoonia TaxID=2629118 RepID=UPI002AFDFF3F|nr:MULTISPECIES: uroporphyrinogen-III synthase [unclassified Yoonia]